MNMLSTMRAQVVTMLLAALAACLFPLSAAAAGSIGHDHPLLSRYPGSKIVAYEAKDYEIFAFARKGGWKWRTGKLTWIVYQVPADNSTLQVFRNYQAALADGGFGADYTCELEACGRNFLHTLIGAAQRTAGEWEEFIVGSGRYIAASRTVVGGTTWVSILVHQRDQAGTVAIREAIVEPAEPRAVDVHAEFETNFPGSRRFGGLYRKYDEVTVPTAEASDGKLGDVLKLEGEVLWKVYALPLRVAGYEAIMGYGHALRDAGFETVFFCGRGCGRGFMRGSLTLSRGVVRDGDHWIDESEVYLLMRRDSAQGSVYMGLWTYRQPNGYDAVRAVRVRTKPLPLGLIKVSADAMAKQLRKVGKVELNGIYFDVDRATVRADSGPVLDEIVRMLEANRDMALYVDGHTDSQGADDYNLDLSRRRAAAVVAALTGDRGIDPGRLQARGFGESKPVASNETERGRARNRRVELVLQTQS